MARVIEIDNHYASNTSAFGDAVAASWVACVWLIILAAVLGVLWESIYTAEIERPHVDEPTLRPKSWYRGVVAPLVRRADGGR